MFDYFEISYLDALEMLGEELLSEYIDDFECHYIKGNGDTDDDPKVNDVEKFIKNKIQIYDQHGISRSYLIFCRPKNSYETKLILVAYYSIAFKPFEFSDDVTNSSKRKISGHHTLMRGPLPAILIGQLGKNESDIALNGSLIHGSEIMKRALTRVKSVHDDIAFSLIYLECKDCDKLRGFYSKLGFTLHANNKGTPYKNDNNDLVRFIAPVSLLNEI